MLRQRKKEKTNDDILEEENKTQNIIKPLQINNIYNEKLSKKYSESKFDSLVISCGGVNINKIVGIAQKFYEDKKLEDVIYYSGTSAGAIVTLLLIINYTPKEILNYLLKIDYKEIFRNINLQKLIESNSILPNNILINHISEMVQEKLGFIPTMIELHELTKKTWSVATFNYTDYKIEYIDYKTHPDILCTHVGAASACIPILFSPVLINDKKYIDGGVVDSFPVKNHLKNHNSSNILGIIMNDDYNSDVYRERRESPTTMQLIFDILYINKRKKEDKIIKMNDQENICIFNCYSEPGSGLNFSMDEIDKLRGFLESYNFIKKIVTKP